MTHLSAFGPPDELGDTYALAIIDRCWRVFGAERVALREIARSSFGGAEELAKRHFAGLGLFLARLELSSTIGCETVGSHFVLARAIYHARVELGGERPGLRECGSLLELANCSDPGAELHALLELSELRCAPTASRNADEMRALVRAATATQERQLIRAFRKRDCNTLGDVERLLGWSRGHASMIVRRLREKVIKQDAA